MADTFKEKFRYHTINAAQQTGYGAELFAKDNIKGLMIKETP